MPGLKFRILLDSIDNKEVMRDIVINDDFNFEHFYHAILDAFGFPNDQMASFFVSDTSWEKGEEISLMDMSFDIDPTDETPVIMNDLTLKERIHSPVQRFILVHDFLSMWIFLIELREITNEEVEHPQLLLEVGEVPEELIAKGPKPLEDMNFETDFNPDSDDFNDLDGDFFENIDDLDI